MTYTKIKEQFKDRYNQICIDLMEMIIEEVLYINVSINESDQMESILDSMELSALSSVIDKYYQVSISNTEISYKTFEELVCRIIYLQVTPQSRL
ncbi:gp240 [Sphingomonas phage PAU]|uniref:gp240 n=1 Tax=Sphingomonas phage PAU TaxID=1150991 RepID=UPI00025733F6|nr:gp240 [Sphingomonas phage PAU]AFF28238.1 gp240 [Sphingomonas phage PAU]